MNENKYLYERIKGYVGEENWENIPIPLIIKDNLNPKFNLRPYQKEAFRYFINYWEKEFKEKPNQHQLLFLMATGSGKTLMMARLILYLYQQGYRNFLYERIKNIPFGACHSIIRRKRLLLMRNLIRNY